MNFGKYIVFEGINSCGKGTQIAKLTEHLCDSSRDVFLSRIRTPNELDDNGRKARELLSRDGNPYENALEAVGFFGKNHRTTASHINSLLNLGHIVICDRNYFSIFAFQYAQGVPYNKISEAVNNSKVPDLTFFD